MLRNVKSREITIFEAYYRREGEKISKVFKTKAELNEFVSKLKNVSRRKYLGSRRLTVVELDD